MKEACLRREKMNNKEDKEMNGLMDSNLKKPMILCTLRVRDVTFFIVRKSKQDLITVFTRDTFTVVKAFTLLQ